jgi:hypothetical protein
MRKRIVAAMAVGVLAAPSSVSAAPAWIPGSDAVSPAEGASSSAAVVTPDLRTVALWGDPPEVHAAVRPRGGTFGEPFLVDDGDNDSTGAHLDAVALPDGEVLAVWSGAGASSDMLVKSVHPDGAVTEARPVEVDARFPAMATNGAGAVALAYYSGANQVWLTLRPAGADAFAAPVLLASLTGNEQAGPLDITLRDDGQVAVAIGTSVQNPPGGTARIRIARYTGGAPVVETVDSVALTLTPTGPTDTAEFRGAMDLLADGRQFLAYRLTTDNNGFVNRRLRGGPRDGSGGAPPLIAEEKAGPFVGAEEHGLTMDGAGRPWVWWREGLSVSVDELRIQRGTTAGAFTVGAHQSLANPAFGSVDLAAFGAGRTGVLFTEGGKVRAAMSEAGAAFGGPVDVATPAAMPSPFASPVTLAGAGEGSGLAFWAEGADANTAALRATPFDATPPTLPSITAPSPLTAGSAGTFAATAQDDWSTASVSWLFSDGAAATGASVQKAFSATGAFAATATATDGAGNSTSGTRTGTVDPSPTGGSTSSGAGGDPSGATPATGGTGGTPGGGAPVTRADAPPRLSDVRLAPTTLRRGRRSTTLRFRLDEPATLVVQVERARPGFRSGRRCVARPPRVGTPRRCTRFVRAGAAIRRRAGAGAGRLTIARPRARGRHRVAVRAVDAAGNRSPTQHRVLTVR